MPTLQIVSRLGLSFPFHCAKNFERETISQSPAYTAFISYAHVDERVAKKLHHALEAYDLPEGLLVNGSESFSPIFRDVTELTAAHSLTEKIQEALQNSKFLIVLCSPAAKASHWVNEEIRLFRQIQPRSKQLPTRLFHPRFQPSRKNAAR